MDGATAGLVERERELRVLDGLLRDAAAGSGRLAVVEGPAGIGKSRLLQELRGRADASGARVLYARAGELEREFGFGVVRQLFEAGVAADPALLEGAAAPAAAVLDVVGGEDAAGDAAFAALHGLYWLTLNVATSGPLVVAVDDLHWCDRPSLRYLAYLARRLDGAPILVAATLRTGEPGVDPTLIAEVAGDASAVSIAPGPLSADAVGAVAGEALGAEAAPAFAEACHSSTGGNPLLLRQLLRALEAEGVPPDAEAAVVVREIGPRAIARTVLLRLGRLGAAPIAVARAVALLGESADPRLVAALTDLTAAEVADGAAALAAAEILRPEPPLGFVHPLVQDAVYRELPAAQRELDHLRAAEALRAAGADVDAVATQLLHALRDDQPWVVAALREAASVARRRGAPEGAVAYLQRALAEAPTAEERPHVLLELGLGETLTNGPAASEHLGEAYATLADPAARARAASTLARVLFFTRPPGDAYAFACAALAELPDGDDIERYVLQATATTAIAVGARPDAELDVLRRWRDVTEDELRRAPGRRLLAGHAAYLWAEDDGPADACAALALRALGDGELFAIDNGLFSITPCFTLAIADREEAIQQWELALADAHRHGSLYSISAVHAWLAATLHLRGDLVDAEALHRQAYDEFATWGSVAIANLYNGTFLARTLVERGDLAGARDALALAPDPANDSDAAARRGLVETELLLAEGRHADALAGLRRRQPLHQRRRNPAVVPWGALQAEALVALGRSEEALPLAEADVGRARAFGAPAAISRTLRALAAAQGPDGLAALEEAVAAVAGSPAKLEHAKALTALGRALRLARRPTDAREPLRRALELATACGAAPLAQLARAELLAAGMRPRTTALTGPAALTASEHRVAALAADGASNRDIAQALYVTPKTVEVHLSNAYRKLGIRTRHDLAGALA